jgi:type 1 glutamine amidotransferase
MLRAEWLLALCFAGWLNAQVPAPTFTKDVAPILQSRCQVCHRSGEAAPFSLMTYAQARPWAKAIREAVLARKMPPWFADAHYGKFANDRSLTKKEIDTIVAWVDNGAPQGNPKDMPPPREFAEGWAIPKPDAVIELPVAFEIPATGTIEYQHILIPAPFATDRWVQFAEARPTDRARVHHIIAFIREPGSDWLKEAKPGIPFVPAKTKDNADTDTSKLPSDFLVGYAPGQPPEKFESGQAKLIRAGSDIILQVHYTTNGTPGTDRTRIGLVFAKEPPAKRVFTVSATNGKFRIPAGAPNHQVEAEFELGSAVTLYGLHPHMHGRGKDFEYRVKYPDGETRTLLKVPNYRATWQLWYELSEPLALPKGARIQCTAHFDNSPNNELNPDPTKDVVWGDQSWDEMMVGFFNVVFDASMPLKDLFPLAQAQTSPPRKKLLVIGEEKGYRHEAIPHAMATIERLGRDTGLWDTVIRTDTEPLTKKKLEYNARNLNDFDAVLFYTGGTLEMDEQQKADFLSFVRDDGKGFIGVHSATITFTKWPEYGEMIGGYFDEHPWGTFDAPILVEDAAFPGMKQWPKAFTLKDEIYQVKNFSRDNTRVLMRLDPAKLDLANPRVHRTDNDFAVSWARMYGKGRVFYSTLGHVESNWDRPEMQKMYVEAIKWALGLVDADVTPRPVK